MPAPSVSIAALRLSLPVLILCAGLGRLDGAEVLTATLTAPAAPASDDFHMGAAQRPDGSTLTVDTYSLRRNGRPWAPVMGEFHYTRYPETEWREELLKMKAGGVDIVATYVFWIHHEEIEGQWDWSGRRNLREFVRQCGEVGLEVVVRCGPWCHGEVRNGGLPEWTLDQPWRTRSTDEGFLAKVRILYAQIARQLRGQLWKDGGPVIGIQLDNEYRGPAAYLLALKSIARDAGLDVPLYTRTGWPQLTTPMPFGEIVPLYGAYAEGFWDRELTPMPGRYWAAFRFSTLRIDDNIANEQLGRLGAGDPPDVARYPYLTCEIGGGMMNSYHRRILIEPGDIESTVLVKLGSGSTLPGYYMYHGGTNPDGERTTLMEQQNTRVTNWNDMPVKNYDFQTLLGEYGQIRPQYHLARRLHLFLHAFGPALAGMLPSMPDVRPGGPDDTHTLRWSARSDGRHGFVFVSNYERSRDLPAHPGVQFGLTLADGSRRVWPGAPVTIPANARLIWPFNLELAPGVTLVHATAQPVAALTTGRARTYFFAETPGVPVEFALAGAESQLGAHRGTVRRLGDATVLGGVAPGRDVAFTVGAADETTVQVVLLSEADSLALYQGTWHGREVVLLSEAGVVVDGDALRLTAEDPARLAVGVFPAEAAEAARGVPAVRDGVFRRLQPPAPRTQQVRVNLVPVQPAGEAREIPLGPIQQPVAVAPDDGDFARAAVWRIELPADLDLTNDPLLRLRYVGDVARVSLNGRLLTDDFYNGNAWEIGLRRHAPDILTGDLRVAILPLRRDAVIGEVKKIFMAGSAIPEFGSAAAVGTLQGVELVPRYQASIVAQ